MCAVSAVHDDWRLKHPDPTKWNRDWFKEYQRQIDAARIKDIKDNAPDCEDPKKAEFYDKVLKHLESIDNRLRKLEEKSDNGPRIAITYGPGTYYNGGGTPPTAGLS